MPVILRSPSPANTSPPSRELPPLFTVAGALGSVRGLSAVRAVHSERTSEAFERLRVALSACDAAANEAHVALGAYEPADGNEDARQSVRRLCVAAVEPYTSLLAAHEELGRMLNDARRASEGVAKASRALLNSMLVERASSAWAIEALDDKTVERWVAGDIDGRSARSFIERIHESNAASASCAIDAGSTYREIPHAFFWLNYLAGLADADRAPLFRLTEADEFPRLSIEAIRQFVERAACQPKSPHAAGIRKQLAALRAASARGARTWTDVDSLNEKGSGQ